MELLNKKSVEIEALEAQLKAEQLSNQALALRVKALEAQRPEQSATGTSTPNNADVPSDLADKLAEQIELRQRDQTALEEAMAKIFA
jgi:hypothetical protein